ncbi:AAA family ATPase [Clavibacter michiganensis]|nr:ATP-binding protein [Clavibacter michiganensis]
MARKYKIDAPAFTRAIVETLRQDPLRSVEPGASVDQPLDGESRLPLLRREYPIILTHEPILESVISASLQQIVNEYRSQGALVEAGLAPTRTALLVGPPGVGKTLAARWVAKELNLPLLTLDLSSVMSSFLGRSGVNIRRVLEHARSAPSILLLDELDAVAKRRDDTSEIGELKRLVTVLLQEIDAWPDGALLLAATNHGDLLDPAIWRRFDVVLNFPLPTNSALREAIEHFLDEANISPATLDLVARLYNGDSLSNLERDVLRARRAAVMTKGSSTQALLALAKDRFTRLPAAERGRAAASLIGGDMSQRAVHELTGVSRDTLRKYSNIKV